MADNLLLGPAARQSILARTFLDYQQELHLRELVRLTGYAPRTIQQEVDKLVAAGLLQERRVSNRRYLRANERHPLFAAVREIILKTDGLAFVLRDALGQDGIEFSLVFGSIAARAGDAGSDIDLLVVGSVSLRETVKRLRGAADVLGREINPVVWSKREFDNRRRTNDSFLARVMSAPTIAVVGDVPTGSI
jgi:predicted nucleotidyltransferase